MPNVLSPRDLVSRPDNMDETVLSLSRKQFLHSFHALGLPCIDPIQEAIKLCVMFS